MGGTREDFDASHDDKVDVNISFISHIYDDHLSVGIIRLIELIELM